MCAILPFCTKHSGIGYYCCMCLYGVKHSVIIAFIMISITQFIKRTVSTYFNVESDAREIAAIGNADTECRGKCLLVEMGFEMALNDLGKTECSNDAIKLTAK